MNNSRDTISSKQLFIFIITSQIATGEITIANHLAITAGHDGWISVILSGIIFAILMLIFMLFLKSFGDKSILQINSIIYGKWLGGFFNTILIVYTYIFACITLRRMSDLITSKILNETPPLIVGAFVILPTLYLVWYGLKPICRVGTLIFLALFFALCIYAFSFKEVRLTNLLPIGEAGIIPITKSIYTVFYSYMGFELIIFVYPNIRDKQKALKYAELGNLLTMTFYTITVLIVTATFGENMLQNLQNSLIYYSRIVSIPIIERIDLFVIELLLVLVAFCFTNLVFCTYYSLIKLLTIKRKKLLLLTLVFTILFVSRIPKDFNETNIYSSYLSIYAIFIYLFIIVSFIISFFKNRGAKQNEKTIL